jgi:hypothetical protein
MGRQEQRERAPGPREPGAGGREAGTSRDPAALPEGGPGGVSRRHFLTQAGMVVGAAILPGMWRIDGAEAAPDTTSALDLAVGATPSPRELGPAPDRTVMLRRREDQLLLAIGLYGITVVSVPGGGHELRPKSRGATPMVVVGFPAQHLLEEAVYEYDAAMQGNVRPQPPGAPKLPPFTTPPLPPPPLGVRMAGPSRLGFDVPRALFPLPFTAAALLTWDDWIPRLVPVALPPGQPAPQPPRGATNARSSSEPSLRAPTATETAIELPLFLQLSPHARTGWVHAATPVEHEGRTELWHTRLAGRIPGQAPDEADVEQRTLRAIWTRDPGFATWLNTKGGADTAPSDGETFPLPSGYGMPFRASVAPSDRYGLVVSTADFSHRISGRFYAPLPLDVDRLHLTSLGATYRARGTWDPGGASTQSNAPGGLEAYRHESTLGRDHFVRVVYRGHLLPFGHSASLVKVTERKFATITVGFLQTKRRIAYLRQRYYLVVREPLRRYGTFDPNEARDLPFSQLRLTTMVTPNLDPPGDSIGVPAIANATQGFVPTVGGAPFPFQFTALDRAGRSISGTTPMVFVTVDHAYDETVMAKVRTWFHGPSMDEAPDAARTIHLHGTPVAFAPSVEPGDTWLESHRVTWGAKAPTGTRAQLLAAGQPRFLPTLRRAKVRLQAAEAALGAPLGGPGVDGDGRVTIVFSEDYVASGFGTAGANVGEVFVELEDTTAPANLDFGAQSAGDRSGGVAVPSIAITALSRAKGPVGGIPADFAKGKFDPTSFFPASATLLGDISLAQIVGPLPDFTLGDTNLVEITSALRPAAAGSPERLETRIRWAPDPKDVGELLVFGSQKHFVLDARTVVPTDGTAASTEIVGDLRDFRLTLLPGADFLIIDFDQLRFRSKDGKKPDVDVLIRKVTFAGPLTFLAKLQDLLRFGGGSGPAIELLPSHLDISYTLPLPDLTIGVFSLQNLSFTAGMVLPFTGEPVRTRFAFAAQDDPFLLTVMVFGGGGYFELGIGTDGVESFQVALEFGGSLALDVGVASGSVSVMAGIYFAIGVPTQANPEGACELTGYVRVKGEVDVLGVITAMLLLELSLTYLPSQDKAIGNATMIVEVEVLLISGSVEVTVEKRFGGSEDPTFRQTLKKPKDWADYCNAFAAV